MTTTQRIVWTALPNGVDRSFLKLSVFVAPRLRTDEGGTRPTLAQFPDFVDWPSLDIRFQVRIDGGEPVDATRSELSADASELWKLLFPKTTFVRPHTFTDISERPVRSFSPSVLADYTTSLFKNVLMEPTQPADTMNLLPRLFPAAREESGTLVQLLDITKTSSRDATIATIESRLRKSSDYALLTQLRSEENFAQLQQFHAPVVTEDDEPAPPPEIPDIDFHQTVGLLGDHPGLLRRLGLIVDLVVPSAAFGTVPASCAVTVEPVYPVLSGRRPATVHVTPATRTNAGALRFEAQPEPNSILDGRHVAVGRPEQFDHHEFEVEAAARALELFTDGLARQAQTASAAGRTAGRTVLPAVRTAGIQVSQRSRAARTATRLRRAKNQNAAIEANQPLELSADDVYRGFRPDIWDDRTGQWHSLVARRATYDLVAPGGRPLFVDDEAVVSPSMTAKRDASNDLYQGESLFTWRGWSLAAPRPGLPISEAEFPGEDGFPEAPNTAAAGVPLEITSVATPGSLPRLRFGYRYRARLRAVDLAGNSVSLTEGAPAVDSPLTTPVITHRRFEPVPSPTLLHRTPRTVTERVDRVVIRSSDFDAPGENTPEAIRHVVAPKTSQQMAEDHGRFDAILSGQSRVDKAAYPLIIERESQTFEPITTVDPNDPNDSFVDLDEVRPPYLPDPMARGAAFIDLPGRTDPAPLRAPYLDDEIWPDCRGLRMLVRDGDGIVEAEYSPGDSTVTVPVPRGVTAKIRIGCHVFEEDLDLFGLFGIFSQDADIDQERVTALREAAVLGLVPNITPSQSVTLVHAVRQPVSAPVFVEAGTNTRQANETFSFILGDGQIHAHSTGRIDVTASWSDWIDNGPGTPTPTRRSVDRTFVDTIPTSRIEDAIGTDVVSVQTRHDFGDTRRRKVDYRMVGTTRYIEEFRRRAMVTLGRLTPVTLDDLGLGIVDSTVIVRSADGTVTFRAGRDYTVDGESSEIARTANSTIAAGATVQVDYVAAPLTRESEVLETDIRSSARPPAPIVEDVVPALAWKRATFAALVNVGRRTTSTRTGNTLRVLLRRPWFTSGEGERLGVVAYRTGSLTIPDAATRANLTEWGHDPTVSAPALPDRFPGLAAFTNAVENATGLAVPGLSGTVDVAGHAVEYDKDRDLWFSDIVVDAGAAYMPFIRLALVRFQPHSVEGLNLSSVVSAPIMQLLPNRTTTVSATKSPREFFVTLAGGPLSAGMLGVPTSDVAKIVVEESLNPSSDESRWVQVSSQPMSLTTNGSFTGKVTLRKDPTPGRYRIVVEQSESIPTGDAANGPRGERLVHLDTVELPF